MQLVEFNPDELLLGYQKRWVADDAPLKIAEKSRRTGLTWAEASDAVLSASKGRSSQGTNHFYVGSNKEMAREFIDAAAMWAKAFDKAAGDIQEEVFVDEGQEGKEILTFVIHFASGFKIQALSSKPSNLRGMQGNVTIDEAAFHEQLAEVLKAALALTMWGAKIRIISTHNGDGNLFNQLIEDSRAGKKRYSVHRITLDDACAEGLYQRICQVRGIQWTQALEDDWKAGLLKDTASEEDALEEYCCVPKSGGGAYLNRAIIEKAMQPQGQVLRLKKDNAWNAMAEHLRSADIKDWCQEVLLPWLESLSADYRHCLGEDFARKGDLTCLWVGQINQDLSIHVPLAVELKNIPYRQQEQILFYLIDRLPRFVGAQLDATGNGDYLAEQTVEKYGVGLVEAVKITENWYRENMPRMKAHFEDFTITIPKDADIMDDLRALQINARGVPSIPQGKTDQAKDRHGDSAVACCMMVAASQMEGGEIAFTPLPSKQERWGKPNHNDDFKIDQSGCY
ncbi:terminase family protein [uncultured Paraglaciecola sp.]|uniref:terminase large subunit domain-containing protein n=1 Tax=uncultured Paraglaciecola sp. TaxID=1765024 RepID=UPI002635A437|nr:terminase family protein [uncultured Paraglaciecola sp.]